MKKYLSLIAFSHTIFALPFALSGFVLGVQDSASSSWPLKLIAVLACMVFARSAAMAFNRWLDRDIDAVNPRTVAREIPAGKVSSNAALTLVILMSLLFVLASLSINFLCFILSPVALLVILGYSYTKRFTPFCHVVLGAGLGLAPVGAYLAMTGTFAWVPVQMGLAVMFWVAGFDIIYALQDEEFDRIHGLHSVPVYLGRKKSMRLSQGLHLASALLLLSVTVILHQNDTAPGWFSWLGLAVFLLLLVYQHTLISETDLSRVDRAFFTTNGIASVIFGAAFIADMLLK